MPEKRFSPSSIPLEYMLTKFPGYYNPYNFISLADGFMQPFEGVSPTPNDDGRSVPVEILM